MATTVMTFSLVASALTFLVNGIQGAENGHKKFALICFFMLGVSVVGAVLVNLG